ncbi:DUF111 family protein [Clostridium botulinum]|nr:DUF111 family protein [Clostridium botulinum]
MNLGALIDLGVDKEYLLKELAKLNINDEFEIKINKDSRKGISGTKVDVILKIYMSIIMNMNTAMIMYIVVDMSMNTTMNIAMSMNIIMLMITEM